MYGKVIYALLCLFNECISEYFPRKIFSYTINFLRPAKGQRLRSKGAVIKPGKRQVIVRADVWAESDGAESVHVATAQATIIPTSLTR